MSSLVLPAGAAAAELTEVAPAIAVASGKARRDIAFVPQLVIAGGAVALIASQVLRPEGAGHAGGAVTIGLAITAIVVCLAWFPAHRLVTAASSRALFRAYTAVATALLVGLTVIAATGDGLTTLAIGASVIVAPTAGLALPTRWSRVTIAAMLASMGVVHAIRPEASALEAASILGLVLAGWVIGLILRRGHRGASRDALLLSRGDQSTGALNRRGFIETGAYDLDRAARRETPLLLLAIGLRDGGLAAALERGGTADDRDPLELVASVLAGELPEGAALGRLGTDQLGVVIPGGRSVDGDWFAATARTALDGRTTVFVGAASAPDGTAPLGELLDVAEACLLEARRRSPQGAQLSEVFGRPATRHARRGAAAYGVHRPPVTYARLRAAGGPPASVEPWGIDGQWLLAGMSTVALAGFAFVVGSILQGLDGLAADVVAYLGVPWALACVALGVAYRRHPRAAANPPRLPVYGGTALAVSGIAIASLATGDGILSPVIAGFYLKAFFDASTFDRSLSRPLLAGNFAAWALVVACGPTDALWAAPFEAALIFGAFSIGTLGHNAYDAATSGRLDLARTDPFTGLLDRRGFYERGELLLDVRAPHDRTTLGVILIDIESRGTQARATPAAGPRRTAAGVVAQVLRDASVVAQFGAGEFRAIVRVDSRTDLETLVSALHSQITSSAASCRVGGALHGPDGVSLDALVAIASHRARRDDDLADAA